MNGGVGPDGNQVEEAEQSGVGADGIQQTASGKRGGYLHVAPEFMIGRGGDHHSGNDIPCETFDEIAGEDNEGILPHYEKAQLILCGCGTFSRRAARDSRFESGLQGSLSQMGLSARLYRELGIALNGWLSTILKFKMKNVFGIATLLLAFVTAGAAQAQSKPQAQLGGDITGLYSFVHEGEFVQIEVNDGKVTGLVSHFKDEDLEKAEFIDQYFAEAKLEGTTLTFKTKPADGAWFEFSGTVERGSAKTPSDEGYWIVKGTLLARRTGADGRVSEKSQGLTMKSFPQDAETPAQGGVSKE